MTLVAIIELKYLIKDNDISKTIIRKVYESTYAPSNL